MLSPGKFHLLVPKEPAANRRYRRETIRRCQSDLAFRKQILSVCRHDIIFWVNTFAWAFNPRKKDGGAVGPFITYDFQDQFFLDRPETTGRKGILWCYEKDRTGVVQKSRDMGASWMFLLMEDWLATFHRHVQCLNVSRSADAVDDKSPDSLFWKIRHVHRYSPDWLRGEVLEEKMYFEYERTGSVSTGQASTGRAGVGGRAGWILVDEFPLIQQAKEVRERTANTSDCRFFNGTHTGVGSVFYEMTKSPELVQFTLHWTQHPDKNKGLYRWNHEQNRPEYLRYDGASRLVVPDPAGTTHDPTYDFVCDGTPTGGPWPGVRSPWYDRKAVEIGSGRAVAMDLDVDAQGAASQVFDPLLVRELRQRYSREPDWRGELRFDKDSGEPEELVALPSGRLKLWRAPDSRGRMKPSRYTLAADVSTGSGATPSCCSGIDGRTGEKVLEYSDPHIKNERFAALLVAIATLLSDENGRGAYLAWECPGPGQNVGAKVIELGYRNVYYRTDDNPVPGMEKVSERPGWYTSTDGKQVMIEDYQAALRSGACANYSDEALERCLGFEYKAGGAGVWHAKERTTDPSGGGVNHGDIVIADALAWKLAKDLASGKRKAVPEEVPFMSLAWRRFHRQDASRAEEADVWA